MENAVSLTPDHAKLKRYFEEARDSNDEQRTEALIDRDYFDGQQWTAEERQVLRERKQPDNVFNRVKPAVRGMVGIWEQGETDPRAWPRNPQDEDSADVASKTLRYVKDYSGWSYKRTAAALNYFTEGTCAVVVQVDENSRVDIETVAFEEYFHDPRSRKLDFSDARYCGIAKWMFADAVGDLYPEKREEIENTLEAAGVGLGVAGDTFADRPEQELAEWADKKRRRVFVVEMYHKEGGQWMRSVFWGRGILESGPSPYYDGSGKSCCPIIARSCYIDRDNRRYGEVRDMRGPQDEINKRRSKLLHMLNNRQAVAMNDFATEADAELVRREMSRPDGVIPQGWQPANVNDMARGQFELLAHATQEVERLGVNPAVLAQQSASASGRAQMMRQQAGMTDSAMSLNGLRQFELAVYRAVWDRCRQFWTAPDFIRVTDDEGAPQFIGINQPVQGPPQVMMGPDGMPAIGRPILGYKNALAEMQVDITIDTVPDTANLQAEQFAQLIELARAYGPQEVPFDDILAVSALPEKQKLMAKRRERAEQAQQMGMQQQELAMRGTLAQISKVEADAALSAAKAQTEIQKPYIEGVKVGVQVAEREVQSAAAE